VGGAHPARKESPMTASLLLVAQQSTMPEMDGMFWTLLLSRILHILGAIVLVGGVFYIRTIISPTSAPPGMGPVDQLFGGPRATWAKWVGIATALLILTGLFNYIMIAKQHEKMASSYHMIAGLKMLAAIAVFLLAALLAGRTSFADALRQKWGTWLNVCLVIGIVTVVLGSFLRTYHRVKKVDAATPPQLIAPSNTAG
jgi:uncharacterized membrane protein